MHKAEYNGIHTNVKAERLAAKATEFNEINDIKELIVQLIAKENMPIRIVESKYFTQLLNG